MRTERNPANSATGAYTVKGTFKLVRPSNHTNYYGLIFGGSNLDGPNQSYILSADMRSQEEPGNEEI